MKKYIGILVVLLALSVPCLAANYHIEVLQIGRLGSFDLAVQGMQAELAKNGLVEGQNLTINRTIIDAAADASPEEKAKIGQNIKAAITKIVVSKPNLVVTIGTPATKFAKGAMIGAGIP